MINTSTNLKLKIVTKTNGITLAVTGVAVAQTVRASSTGNLTAAQVTHLTSKGVTVPTDNKITVSNTTSVSSSVAASGTLTETTTSTISSIVPYNESVTIATIRVAAGGSNRISETPYLTINNSLVGTKLEDDVSLSLVPTTIGKSGNNITSYLFNLVYNNSRSVTLVDDLKFDLNFVQQPIITLTQVIKKVVTGKNSVLDINGETREIKVFGVTGTPFELTLTDVDDKSILSAFNANSTTLDKQAGGIITSVSSTIGDKGIYSFKQKFNSTPIVVTTAINGSMAASGATKIIFDSLSGVSVGDQLLMPDIPSTSTVKVVTLNPDTDNVNECTVSSSVTAADNAVAVFRKSTTSYNLNISSTASLDSGIVTTYPSYSLNQYVNPILSIKLTTDRTDYTIQGGSSGADHIDSYSGIANKTFKELENNSNVTKVVQFTYTLDKNSTAAFTLLRQPRFISSTSMPNVSDWTNTDPSLNGGTEVVFSGLSAVLSASDDNAAGICTVKATMTILKYGTSDVTMELDLDNIVS
jgi:hypothetical protein